MAYIPKQGTHGSVRLYPPPLCTLSFHRKENKGASQILASSPFGCLCERLGYGGGILAAPITGFMQTKIKFHQ